MTLDSNVRATDEPHSNAENIVDEVAASVARMGKIGSCMLPSFSPDGGRIAFVSNLSGVPQVWTVPTAGGWPELVTALDDQVLKVEWSPDGEWLAFWLAPGGGLNQQIYVVRPNGMDLLRLTEGGQVNNWLERWTHDGKWLTVASNRRTPDTMDAYLLDPRSGEWRFVADTGGIGQLTDVSRNGRHAVLYRMKNRGDDDLYLVDLESGRETLLTAHTGPGSFDHGRFSPDGNTVYMSSNKDRERRAFARVSIGEDGRAGEIELLAGRDDAELEYLEVSEDGATAALVWNAGGRSELAFFDLRSLQETPGPALPAEVVISIAFSRDARYLALTLTGAASPNDIWVLERQSSKLWQVTHSPHAGVELDRLPRPELVSFQAHDGLELSGWLYRPRAGQSPGPTVLSFHGGPEAQERPLFNTTYQALLSQGIAVFAPNVRGSDGFGKTFVNLDNGVLRVNAVRDIEACVRYVVQAGVAYPGRIGITGGSYGGFMTLSGLAEYPDTFAAGAIICGVVNFETFFAQTEPWMAAISKTEYGDPDTEAEMLRDLSPIHKIDRVKGATIVLHGANDTNVPVVEAEQVVDNLKRRGVPVDYVLYPDEGHGFRKIPNRIHSTVAITRWFVEHLKARQ
ncbi:MAG TPA: S9 family peptidase [Chloroflexia bacterium]|nr:S9 family peptidase [Chloroflexia bacterium]